MKNVQIKSWMKLKPWWVKAIAIILTYRSNWISVVPISPIGQIANWTLQTSQQNALVTGRAQILWMQLSCLELSCASRHCQDYHNVRTPISSVNLKQATFPQSSRHLEINCIWRVWIQPAKFLASNQGETWIALFQATFARAIPFHTSLMCRSKHEGSNVAAVRLIATLLMSG